MKLEKILNYYYSLSEEERAEYKKRTHSISLVIWLYEIIRDRGYKNIIEVGTYKGLSTMFMAGACAQNGGGVDTINISPEELERAAMLFKGAGLTNIKMHVGSSIDVLPKIYNNVKYDMAYIDGNHSYTYVMQEYKILSKQIRPGGVIVFDDINYIHPDSKMDGGVPRAIKEIRPEKILINNDFGIAYKIIL